ncbi:MAG: hypothetical protein M1454_04655 [Candidatus Thermoplasmatota archaeon]|nr:hypothetical protein [Candidatus Thermoplasmatota archaeon]MCL5731177.1 hypothetical protein [Candidatus Thermoplasmatota archaeon]
MLSNSKLQLPCGREVILKIKKLREGQKIAIYPFSIGFGYPFTALGLPCHRHDPDIPL